MAIDLRKKPVLKIAALDKLFSKRKHAARKKYKAAIEGTKFEHAVISYNNILSNPLSLRPQFIKACVDLDPTDPVAKDFHALHRIMDDIQIADAYMVYFLNFVECEAEFYHLVAGMPLGSVSPRFEEFMKLNQDKIQFFRRMRILLECTT